MPFLRVDRLGRKSAAPFRAKADTMPYRTLMPKYAQDVMHLDATVGWEFSWRRQASVP